MKTGIMGARKTSLRLAALAIGAMLAVGCASTGMSPAAPAPVIQSEKAKFEQDRKAILAMTGNFAVTFDFRETVPLAAGYTLKKPKVSGGDEIIRLVEDRGTFISLQHMLVVGEGKDTAVVKHWRQDWTYQPSSVLVFVGGNAWQKRAVAAKDAAGKWSQVVYQVEDSPRYGAVGAWNHANGVSQWNPPAEMRPLPRRDQTTRDDYDAVLAVNRHTITPFGWVQEEENSKLVLRGQHHVLAREIGINTYKRSDNFAVKVGDDYWNATKDFWKLVRADWAQLEKEAPAFGLTVQGEPEPLYSPILDIADDIQAGKTTTADGAVKAREVIKTYTTRNIGTLEARIAEATKPKPAKSASN
jgi:hypothetical protein